MTVLGYVGLGAMGAPYACHLAAAGHAVMVFDPSPAARERLAGIAGVRPAASLAEVVEAAEILFTCLPSPAAVAAVYDAVAKPGLVACDNSTVGPSFARALHARLRERGVAYVECPMLGSVADAEAGLLFLLVSGDEAAIDRVLAFALVAARDHRVVGATGTASLYKTAQNGLGLVQVAAIAEALVLVARGGGDLEAFVELVGAGGGMAASPLFRARAPMMQGHAHAAAGELRIAAKDAALANALALEQGISLPLLARTAALFEAAMAEDLGRADLAAVARIVERETGVSLSPGRRG